MAIYRALLGASSFPGMNAHVKWPDVCAASMCPVLNP